MNLVPKKSSGESTKVIHEQKIENRWVGQKVLRKGMFVFEWADGEVRKASISKARVTPEGEVQKEIPVNKLNRYTTAINLTNAIKKFRKGGLKINV